MFTEILDSFYQRSDLTIIGEITVWVFTDKGKIPITKIIIYDMKRPTKKRGQENGIFNSNEVMEVYCEIVLIYPLIGVR